MKVAPAAPSMTYGFTIDVALQPSIVLADSPRGRCVYIPIVGGTVLGPRIQAEVIPGGGDRAFERTGDVMDIHARYLIRTSDDVVIEVDNRGHWREVPGGSPYFVTAPVFSTDDERYRWLTSGVFIGMAHEVHETRVVIDVYEAVPRASSAVEDGS